MSNSNFASFRGVLKCMLVKRKNCLFWNTIATLILVSGVFSQKTVLPNPSFNDLNAIRAGLEQKMKVENLPSLSLGVYFRGKIVWKESFGWADRERRIKATPETVYALGSLSKSLTGTAIYKLVDEQKVSVSSPISKYLRSARLNYQQGKPEDYKIFHLLTMTAGIPHYYRYYYDDEKIPVPSLPHQIDSIGFTAFKPGEIHHYSNFSFAVLEQVVADVSGVTFESFMQKKIFGPAGMKRTWTHRDSIPQEGVVIARGYDSEDNPNPEFVFNPSGGAGFYSSVEDLLKYSLIHLKGKSGGGKRILRSSTIEANHTVVEGIPNGYYANGWGILKTSDGRVSLLSNGAIAGAATSLLVVPNADFSVVCLVNKSVGNEYTDQIAFDIAGALIPKYRDNLNKLFEKVGPSFEPSKFVADDTLAGKWAGEIAVDSKILAAEMVIEKDGNAKLSVDRQPFQKIDNLRLEGGLITGSFESVLDFPSLRGKEYELEFGIRHNQNKLYGYIRANTTEVRPGFIQPFYIEMERVLAH